MKFARKVFFNSAPSHRWEMWTPALGAWLAVVFACCGRADGQTHFVTELHTAHGAHNHLMAGGRASLALSADQTELRYTIELIGLDLKPDPAHRVDPKDVFGIHLHLIVPGQIGPHILNIFGNPAEDDGDLIVDYSQETLSGIFDAGDATRDPVTGELLPQFFPLTTKVIDDWIEHLMANGLYLAVHTVGQNGGGAVARGRDPRSGAPYRRADGNCRGGDGRLQTASLRSRPDERVMRL